MPKGYSKETEEKLNKSLDDVAKDERRSRRAQKEDSKRTTRRSPKDEKPKTEKRTTKADPSEKSASIKFEIQGDTKRDIFNAAGIGKQNRDFPAINIKIAVNQKQTSWKPVNMIVLSEHDSIIQTILKESYS